MVELCTTVRWLRQKPKREVEKTSTSMCREKKTNKVAFDKERQGKTDRRNPAGNRRSGAAVPANQRFLG